MTDALPEPEQNYALASCLDDSFLETRRLREGGWDGPRMATFIGTLAETGVVRNACRACDMAAKSAYALRHRDPLFANAWEAALDMARARLADELLARSLKGSHEALLRDGAIVAERQHFDNRLAFSILRRLDRRAELGATIKTPPAWEIPAPAPAVAGEWQTMLDAIKDGRTEDAARLLAREHEQGNTLGNDPPICDDEGNDSLDDDDDESRVPRRVWQDWETDEWRTDFPPPPDFDGDQEGDWEDEDYSRSLTGAELDALIAAGLIEANVVAEVSLEEDEAERDRFFASLVTPAHEPGSALPSEKQEKADP